MKFKYRRHPYQDVLIDGFSGQELIAAIRKVVEENILAFFDDDDERLVFHRVQKNDVLIQLYVNDASHFLFSLREVFRELLSLEYVIDEGPENSEVEVKRLVRALRTIANDLEQVQEEATKVTGDQNNKHA